MIDLRYVKKLLEMLDESTVDSLEITSEKGMKIRLAKTPAMRGISMASPMAIPAMPAMPASPAAPPPAAGAPTYNTGAEGALAARAQMKIREIMASNHSAQEKQAMVQQVNAVLAQELRKLRGGR